MSSLAGVAAGLLFNINPVLGATAACVAAAFGIEAIRKKLPRYAEMSIAIILSAGVGLAGVLSGFVRSAASFNSFLFGSIVAISDGELYTVAVVSGIRLLVGDAPDGLYINYPMMLGIDRVFGILYLFLL